MIGVSTLALGIGAAALATSASRIEGGPHLAAGFAAGTLAVLAAAAIIWGFLHIICGRDLRVHHPWARLMALALGAVDLVLVPYGTALGSYALWVLLNDRARQLFEPVPHA